VCRSARCFYVVSQWNSKVLDVRGDEASAGASVIVYERKPVITANQVWYEDEAGILRSKLNGYVIDTSCKWLIIWQECWPVPRWIGSGFEVWMQSSDLDDFQNVVGISRNDEHFFKNCYIWMQVQMMIITQLLITSTALSNRLPQTMRCWESVKLS